MFHLYSKHKYSMMTQCGTHRISPILLSGRKVLPNFDSSTNVSMFGVIYSMIGQILIPAFVITPSTSLPLEPQPPNGSFLFVWSPMKHILNGFLNWLSSQYSSPKHFSNNLHFEISYNVVKVLNNGCFYVGPSMLLPWISNNCADFSFPQYTCSLIQCSHKYRRLN